MLRIAREHSPDASIAVHTPHDDVAALRREFEERHCVRLPGLLDPPLFDEIVAEVEGSEFAPKVHEGIASELCLDSSAPPVGRLLFCFNHPATYEAVEAVTGCAAIARFDGRVYRREGTDEHFDSWHDDLVTRENLVALSLNLSPEGFTGGELQIRDKRSREILSEVANTGPGDAIVFRLAPHLEHRVLGVHGDVPRTAFAGWFRSGPPWLEAPPPDARK